MTKGQMTALDMVLAFSIIMGFVAFFLILFIRGFAESTDEMEIDKLTVFRMLTRNIEGNNSIYFLNGSVIDLGRMDHFGNISQSNLTVFKEYFFAGYRPYNMPDICMFILNRSYDYVMVNGSRFAYGMVNNATPFASAPFVPCQDLIERNENPCAYYKGSESFTKAAFVNGTYGNLYLIFCRP